jgi:hypothetical protein
MLKRELGRADAFDDLQRAVELGTTLVWPYLELARQAINSNDLDRALEFSRLGLQKASDDATRAELLNIEAVAFWTKDAPGEVVRGTFQEAANLDPSNDEVRFNLQVLEQQLVDPQPTPPWKITSRSSVRVMEEIREQLRAAA